MEFSNIRPLVTCLNSIDNPADYRTDCQLPNENMQFIFAIIDRFFSVYTDSS